MRICLYFSSTRARKKINRRDIIAPFWLEGDIILQKKTNMKQTLPVSRKFYSDIISRVNTALSHSPECAEDTKKIIDAYLAGKKPKSTDGMAMVAFNMIKDEIDRAVSRSRRARERAAARRLLKEDRKEEPISSENPSESERGWISRRQRRAAARQNVCHKGRKWAPISQAARSSINIGAVGK